MQCVSWANTGNIIMYNMYIHTCTVNITIFIGHFRAKALSIVERVSSIIQIEQFYHFSIIRSYIHCVHTEEKLTSSWRWVSFLCMFTITGTGCSKYDSVSEIMC